MSSCAQLLVYVRYAVKDALRSELLLINEMRTTTKGEDVFELVYNFFKKNGLQWTKLVGCTTDGATAILGGKSGFQARVKAVSPSVTFVYCFLHQFALAAKLLPPDIKAGLNLVVKMVNYIKTSALNSRLFKVICKDVGSEYTSLLFHTEVGWLSRGDTTMCLFVLRKELLQFLQTKIINFRRFLRTKTLFFTLPTCQIFLGS